VRGILGKNVYFVTNACRDVLYSRTNGVLGLQCYFVALVLLTFFNTVLKSQTQFCKIKNIDLYIYIYKSIFQNSIEKS